MLQLLIIFSWMKHVHSVGMKIVALKGNGGFGNQVHQYLGLAASIRVAKQAELIDTRLHCEFVFQDATVGPSDKDKFANFSRVHNMFTWPNEYCTVRPSYSMPFQNITKQVIYNLTVESLRNSTPAIFIVMGDHCKFHSKSLCYMHGISTREYWKSLSNLASLTKFRSDNNTSAMTRINLKKNTAHHRMISIGENTLCVHLRGKGYEHHTGKLSHKVRALANSLRLVVKTMHSLRRSIAHVHFIAAMDVKKVWLSSWFFCRKFQ